MVITKDIKRAITFIRIMLQGHGYSFYSYYFFNKGEYFIIMSLDLQQYHDQIQALRPIHKQQILALILKIYQQYTVYIFLILIYSKKEKPFTTFENLLSKLTRLLMMALLKYMLTLSLMTKVLSQNIYSF